MLKRGMTGREVRRHKDLEEQERRLLEREEMMWYQGAKANELRWGDRNSGFFQEGVREEETQ